MADATIKRLDQMESFYDGLVTRARAELGVKSWGMQVFDLPPGFDRYPNHHHGEGAGDPGQEEVYIPLAGSATSAAAKPSTSRSNRTARWRGGRSWTAARNAS